MNKQFCPYCMTPVKEGEACSSCSLTAGAYNPSPHHLPPGTILMGRYMVGRVLGEGGFGITYIGCDLRLEMKVAIKEYFPTDKVTRNAMVTLDVTSYIGAASTSYEEGKIRFLNEARTMARMDKQPEIVSVRDFFKDHNTAYIVMEYINGTTFKDLVSQRGGRIPAEDLLPMMEPLFSALSAMHHLGLIHRDISPDNLMLEAGALRLLDFGCARESTRGTETMTISLKHGYAPIEQYQHKGQGPWTDVYALSATIYYCLTGKTPPQSLDRLCEDELILPRKLGVNITERQEKALLYGMGIRPRKRFQSTEELHAALYIPDGAPIPEVDNGDVPISLIRERVSVNTDEVPTGTVVSQDEIPSTSSLSPTVETPPVIDTEKPNLSGEDTPNLFSLLKKHGLAAALGTVAILAIVLGVIFFPSKPDNNTTNPDGNQTNAADPSDNGTSSPSDSTGTHSGNAGETDPFTDHLSNVVTFSADDEAQFRSLMADDSVSAVILNGHVLLTGEEFVITKPLRINHGYGLNSYAPITVADGGYLRTEGDICCEAMMRATGGTLSIASTGRLVGNGFLWLTRDEDVSVEEGGLVDLYGSSLSSGDRRVFLTADEDRIFATATRVSTFEDLLSANEDLSVSAIIIDSDLSIERNFTTQKPVLIREGVTVTGEMSPNHDFSIVPTWCVDGTLLFNRGSFTGCMNLGQWSGQSPAVINYGTMNVSLHVDCSGCLINYGELVSSDTHAPSGTFVNMGRIVHTRDETGSDCFIDLADRLLNHGEILVSGDECRINIAGESMVVNSGSITAENNSRLEVECHLVNCGSIHVKPTAHLDGSGFIEQTTENASLIVELDATFPFCGLLTYNKDSTVRIMPPANSFTRIPFDWGNGGPDWDAVCRRVYNEAELTEALNDPACQIVAIDGDLELRGDRVFAKNFCVAGSITVHDGSLTLTNGAYMISGDTRVENGNLVVEDGAVWLNRSQLKCNELIVQNGAFYNTGWMNEVGRLELSGGNFTNVRGSVDLTASTLEVNHGKFLSLAHLYLHDCEFTIGEGGELCSHQGYFSIDSGTRIENHGHIFLNAWEWQEQMLDITMENYGFLRVNSGARIYGSIDNYGTIEVCYGAIPVNGTVNNHGEIICYSGTLYAADGQITGNPPIHH